MNLATRIVSPTSTDSVQRHKIRVIAFDYGGVLFCDGKQRAIEKLKNEHQYDSDIIWQIMNSPESWELRRGKMTSDYFWKWAQEQMPEGYDSKLIRDTWCSEYVLDEGIMDLLRRLKEQNYRIISCTDGIPERVAYVENKYHFRHHFDAEVHSYEWQAVKTDMAFARALLHTAGCETNPGELLLIDDQAHETELVKELGVNVLLYRTGFLDKLVNDLRDIGIQC